MMTENMLLDAVGEAHIEGLLHHYIEFSVMLQFYKFLWISLGCNFSHLFSCRCLVEKCGILVGEGLESGGLVFEEQWNWMLTLKES